MAASGVVCSAVAEIRVKASLLGRESMGRVILEQRLQELASSLFQSRDNLSIRTLPLRESGFVIRE